MIWREKLKSIKADVGLLMCGFTGGVTQTHILIIMGSSSLGLFFLLSSSSPELHCKVTKSTTNKTSQFSHFFLGGVSRCITKNGTVGAYLRKISNHLYFLLGTILYLYQLENSDSKFQSIISEDDL